MKTYIEDYHILGSEFVDKIPGGLSKIKICIIVVIDVHKNMFVKICAHGKSSSKQIIKTLENHIMENSILIHNGENSHIKLIEKLDLKSEGCIANCKD